jgi:hypothetical protein
MKAWPEQRSTALTKLKLASVADILERQLVPMIKEWLKRVNLIPELTDIPLNDLDRTAHLAELYSDIISRLRLAEDVESPVSVAAAAHGQMRHGQGYSASMLVEESRVFQVATFSTLHLHQNELNQSQVLSDVSVIADEVDAQLMETVRSLMAAANRATPPPQANQPAPLSRLFFFPIARNFFGIIPLTSPTMRDQNCTDRGWQ